MKLEPTTHFAQFGFALLPSHKSSLQINSSTHLKFTDKVDLMYCMCYVPY